MPRQQLPLNPLARLSLERMLPPEPIPPAPALPAEMSEDIRRERRTDWPNNAPDISTPFDLRGSLLAIGAGLSVLTTYRIPAGREGVVKKYGVGFLPTSLIPVAGAPLTFTLAVNGSPVTPDEGIAGWFSIASATPEDADLLFLTQPLRGAETLTVLINNGTGIALDLWCRVCGWHYEARGFGG